MCLRFIEVEGTLSIFLHCRMGIELYVGHHGNPAMLHLDLFRFREIVIRLAPSHFYHSSDTRFCKVFSVTHLATWRYYCFVANKRHSFEYYCSQSILSMDPLQPLTGLHLQQFSFSRVKRRRKDTVFLESTLPSSLVSMHVSQLSPTWWLSKKVSLSHQIAKCSLTRYLGGSCSLHTMLASNTINRPRCIGGELQLP